MRILILHEYNRPYGGGERYLYDTCQGLREAGHRVVVACAPEWDGGFIPSDRTRVIPRSFGLRSGRRAWPAVEALLAEERPEVAYLHGIVRHFVSPEVLRRLIRRLPTLLFVHHVGILCHTARKVLPRTGEGCRARLGLRCFTAGCVGGLEGPALHRWRSALVATWRLRVLRECARIVAPSGFVRETLRDNGVPAERIRVLPYFTDRAPGLPPAVAGNRLLWVGRMDAGKGLDRFLELLGRLPGGGWEGVVVGDETDGPAAAALVHAAGLAGRVRLRGRLEGPALDAEYAAARVVVFTSGWAETFGQVGIEAMAFGRPVVAFKVGGVAEWLADGTTGFLAPPGDTARMAERVGQLLQDEGLAARLGSAGREAVEARFRRRHHLPALVELLEGAARRDRPCA